MPLEGISARKLVLEAARYNVITGYSADDALELIHRFPGVDGMIVHSEIGSGDGSYRRLIDQAIAANPRCFVVLVSPDTTAQHRAAKFHLSSHDPKMLLDLLMENYPPPEHR
jgi:hypothetical protein